MCLSGVRTYVGTLGMILRSSKRLYMRIFYSLVDSTQRYFTLKTINFTSMEEDKGYSPTCLHVCLPVHVHVHNSSLHEFRQAMLQCLYHPSSSCLFTGSLPLHLLAHHYFHWQFALVEERNCFSLLINLQVF